MPAAWKTVRVFISSTFRDMHAERDWLVKRVFPGAARSWEDTASTLRISICAGACRYAGLRVSWTHDGVLLKAIRGELSTASQHTERDGKVKGRGLSP